MIGQKGTTRGDLACSGCADSDRWFILLRNFAGLAAGSLLLIWNVASAQTTENVSSAADKLREGHVLRSFEGCKQRGQTDEACKQELEALLQRDQKALARIASLSTVTSKTELVVAAARCYDPSFDYADMIACREAIADDLEARQDSPQTAAVAEPAPPADNREPVAEESVEAATAPPAPVTQERATAIPKRRPPRFGDIDWADFLGREYGTVANRLSAQAECAAAPLVVPLPDITANTTVGENFWRPVSGKQKESEPEFDESSGLQNLVCDFRSLARANMLFHKDDGTVFRIDIYFQRYRCDDLTDRTCLEESIQERANDIDLYLAAGSPAAYSAFGQTETSDLAYLERYADLLEDSDDKRRLSWSNCATVPTPMLQALEDEGLLHRCIVDADTRDGIWRSISFLEISTPNSGQQDSVSILASKMTFALEPSERTALDRHSIYFQTVVGSRLASASTRIAKDEETLVEGSALEGDTAAVEEAPTEDLTDSKEVVLIKEVSATDTIAAKVPVEMPPPGDQRVRMKAILERLIGLSP